MKRTLIIGLGNTLVPEDAAGILCVRALAAAGVAQRDVDIVEAGTDLLRVAEQMRGREVIVLVDAAEGISAPMLLEHDSGRFAAEQLHAHHLSAVEALDLIRWGDPEVRAARCTWYLLPAEGAG